MRNKFILLLVIVFIHSFSMALPVIINGKSAAGDAFVFRLYVDSDAFSGLKKMTDQQRPDKEGFFSLGFEAQEIQEVTIEVGMQSLKFFVIPGKTYQLNFNEISIENQNVFLPQQPLRVVFKEEDMLNVVLDGFEYDYQKFLEEKFILLIKYRDKELYNDFAQQTYLKLEDSPLFDSISYTYVKDYIDYRLAELSLVAKLQQSDELGIQQMVNKPILFYNTAYISFFKKYFTNYFYEVNEGKDYYLYKSLINHGLPIFDLMDELGKNPVLVNEKLRELVLLYSLKQIYFKPDYNKETLNEIYSYLGNKSKYKSNREIAENLKTALNRFIPGQKVPDFNLTNMNGKEKSLDAYQGKKVYLMFIAPNCETCEADIRILKAIKEEFEEQLTLVTIYTGFDKVKAETWVQSQGVDWDFLWFKDDFNLLNEYRVKTFPKYLMLDENSNLYRYFPPKPRENLLSYLKAIEKQTESKEKGTTEGSKDIFRKN